MEPGSGRATWLAFILLLALTALRVWGVFA
jgi:hypothetical protein